MCRHVTTIFELYIGNTVNDSDVIMTKQHDLCLITSQLSWSIIFGWSQHSSQSQTETGFWRWRYSPRWHDSQPTIPVTSVSVWNVLYILTDYCLSFLSFQVTLMIYICIHRPTITCTASRVASCDGVLSSALCFTFYGSALIQSSSIEWSDTNCDATYMLLATPSWRHLGVTQVKRSI